MTGRLSQGQIIAALGAAVLLVAMFLPWIGVSGPSIPAGIPVPSGVSTNTTENIWKGSTLDIYLLITAVVALLPALLALTDAAEEFSFVSAATFLLGVVAIILVAAFLTVDFPDGADRKYGAFIGLAAAIVVAITDDGKCVQNHELMRRAVEYARMVGVPVLDHCQDYNLVGNGVVNEGEWSTLLGLSGWPAAGEEAMVMRNILLAELCDHHIHCQHISAAGSVRLIREARARGVKISGEVCPHHIALTDAAIQNFDTNCKMNPPLRTQGDIDAIIEGIRDGTLSILCSDHAPHAAFEKEVEFDQAPFGIVGLETELGLFIDILVHKRKAISINRLIEMFTVEPAKLLKIDAGTLSIGVKADITLIDREMEWRAKTSESLSRNTPFDGWKLKGRAVRTIVSGETVWQL